MQFLDFSALEHNALYFKNLLGGSRLCAVVKNDAYGHGIAHVARYLDNVVDCFAVGSIDEARQIGFVSKDVLILIPQGLANTQTAINDDYILSLDSFETLNTILAACAKTDRAARVHIKLDSGMSRLGFKPSDVEKLVFALRKNPQIAVEGVYSHFYNGNTVDCDKQLGVFLPCAQVIESALNKRLIKHIANSGGALLSNRYHLDMARIGLGLYGYGDDNLIPVKTARAKVVAVKDVCKGDVVGYGANFKADCNLRIAVVNVGYAHGFARTLTGSQVLVNGVKCRTVAVCMAMIMVDVSKAVVEVGDEVTLLGKGVNISNDVVSVYELLCNLK